MYNILYVIYYILNLNTNNAYIIKEETNVPKTLL